MHQAISVRAILGAALVLLCGCTVTDTERKTGTDAVYLVEGTAACLGLCAPDRTDILAEMHRTCSWPAVPAVLARGSEDNGLVGVPHALWRFTCLELPRETELAEAR